MLAHAKKKRMENMKWVMKENINIIYSLMQLKITIVTIVFLPCFNVQLSIGEWLFLPFSEVGGYEYLCERWSHLVTQEVSHLFFLWKF